jgi:HEAT repeat protein
VTREELDQALQGLASGKLKLQVKAQEWLLEQAEQASSQALVAARVEPLLTHPDSQVRGTACLVLATARGEAALPLLAPRAADPVSGARCALAEAGGIIGQPARALLRTLVADGVFAVRLEAAIGLAELGDGAGLDALVEGLAGSGLRFETLSALRALADTRALEPVRRFFRRILLSGWERTAAAGVLARLGDREGRAFLIDKIARRRGDELGLAIEIAGDLKLAEAREGLQRVAAEPSQLFRGAALRALGMLGDEAVLGLLTRVLLDEAEDAAVRMDAAEGLMHLGTPRARALLEEASRAVRDEELAKVVCEALATLGPNP